MRAAVIGAGGALDVREVPDPSPGEGELLVRVTACGICGSDLKARAAMPEGTVMGHELCGEVVGIGRGTTGWREGTHVAVLPVFSCGTCEWCRAGDVAHCGTARLLGLGGGSGGFAELTVASADLSFALPPGLPARHGALVEPFAVGLHGARIGGISPGDDVLVVGAGAVGLTTMAWARDMGAERITVVDPSAERRAASAPFGATDVLASAAEADASSYDVAVECVGKPGLLDACIAATRIKGRIVVAGVCTEPDPFWPIGAMMKQLTIAFSVYYRPEEFRAVIEAFGRGRIDPAPLAGHALGLERLDEAFGLAAEAHDPKILIEPGAR